MESLTATAWPRVGLLGNPSDGFGGRVIAFTFEDFSTQVAIVSHDRVEALPGNPVGFSGESWPVVLAELDPARQAGGGALVAAAMCELADHCAEGRIGPAILAENDVRLRFRLAVSTDIPLQAGLSGSSAIIIATLRALADWFSIRIEAPRLAILALAAETERLGVTAGPQDRVIQAHEGLLDMDFAEGTRVERLDPRLLPPLFVAWDPEPGESSGRVHADVGERWRRDDAEVVEAMARLRGLAEEGRGCLLRGDAARLMELVDENFETRSRIYAIRDRDREMVSIGRRAGAAVKFCGSGGSVLGVLPSASAYEEIAGSYRRAGYRILRPRITGASDSPVE